LQDIPHDHLSAKDAELSGIVNSPAAELAEEMLDEINGEQAHHTHVPTENEIVDNGKKKKKPKKKDAKETFKEELQEYLDLHIPEPMSSSDYEEELEKWIHGHGHKHGKLLTPGPHFPRHMQKELKHHHHRVNDENEMSDRLRYNINYMPVPPKSNHRANDIPSLAEEVQNGQGMEPSNG
jgi:hypothetical protein